MTLKDEFESIRSSLLHHNLFPTLDTVIKDLILEQDRLNTLQAKHTPPSIDVDLATQVSLKFVPSAQTSTSSITENSSRPSQKIFCHYCKKPDHIISECRQLQAKQSSSQNTIFHPMRTSVVPLLKRILKAPLPNSL